MVDMRKRFRGNKTFAVDGESTESEGSVSSGSGSGSGGMLYAGKPFFVPVVKESAGVDEGKDWRELDNEKYRDSVK
jgi:hypothetical protein